MSSGVLVLGEIMDGGLRPSTLELIGAGLELSRQGAGPLTVALVDAAPEAHADALNLRGVEELVLVRSPHEHFEAHVSEAALAALIAERRPAVVLAGHTVSSFGFVPALAARAGLGFASDVTAAQWSDGELLARRPAYGERLVAELDFPAKQAVVLLLRPGSFPTAEGTGEATVSRPEVDLASAGRSELIELRPAPAGDLDIAKADFVMAIGRGIGEGKRVAELETLAQRMGAALASSGPLVEAGWMPRTRKVGQSGRTVAPRVYLALGISGAPQHLAGVSRARTIIAVNSDPGARIFDVAHYGAVADLFEIAAELGRALG